MSSAMAEVVEWIDAQNAAKPKPPHPLKSKIKYAPALAAPLPPVEWICQGYSLAKASYCVVAGESYSGKSLWLTDLALAIAFGGDAVGLFKAKQGKVLWLDYDGQGEEITMDRLQRMTRARGKDLASLEDAFGYLWLPDVDLDAKNAVEPFCELLEGVSFAVIDSWRGACPNTDEKERGAVQRVGKNILKIIERTKCSIMIVDHTIKPAREGKSTRSAMHDVHGSTAKMELAQWAAIFDKQEGKPVRVIHTKERKQARTMAPFSLAYVDVAKDAEPRWGLRVDHLDKEQLPSGDDHVEAAKHKVLALALRARRPLTSRNEICERIGGRKATVLLAISELIQEQKLLPTTADDGPFTIPPCLVKGGR